MMAFTNHYVPICYIRTLELFEASVLVLYCAWVRTTKSMRFPFKVYVGPVSRRHSPRSGLLAISHAFRSLGLLEAIERRLTRGSVGEVHQARIIESLLLLQAAGADSVADCELLRNDPCIKTGLSYTPPSSKPARTFLERLSTEEKEAADLEGTSGFQSVLADAAAAIWKNHRASPHTPKPDEIPVTIDVILLPAVEPPHISWVRPVESALPGRVVCLWREADLFLSGGFCRNSKMLIRRISQALAAIPMAGFGRLIRSGLACCDPVVLSWLSEQQITFDIKIRDWRTKKLPVGFILGTKLTSDMVAALDRERIGWSREGLQSNASLDWKEFTPPYSEQVLPGLRLCHVALRRAVSEEEPDQFAYTAFVTNRGRGAGAMAAWFIKGNAEVNRAIEDLTVMAKGLNPDARSDKTGEGRFQVALLSYNICAAIRRLCFAPRYRHVSINRFRELLVHATGRMVISGRPRWLKISQSEARLIFGELQRRFRYKRVLRVSV